MPRPEKRSPITVLLRLISLAIGNALFATMVLALITMGTTATHAAAAAAATKASHAITVAFGT
jgi:hypothetical protein